jgi:hypothetical protein
MLQTSYHHAFLQNLVNLNIASIAILQAQSILPCPKYNITVFRNRVSYERRHIWTFDDFERVQGTVVPVDTFLRKPKIPDHLEPPIS